MHMKYVAIYHQSQPTVARHTEHTVNKQMGYFKRCFEINFIIL